MGRRPAVRQTRRVFWRGVAAGSSNEDAAAAAGVSAMSAWRWFDQHGGVSPLCLSEPGGRYLGLAEREEIAIKREQGVGVRQIAREVGRDPSTISRELRRHRRRLGGNSSVYRAHHAQAKADVEAGRPKPTKLETNPRLARWVQRRLRKRWSPEQISKRLVEVFPDDERMRVSHESIYQALYVQGRGGLRRELTKCLRTGRAVRRPRRRVQQRTGPIKDKLLISHRPAEAEDRAVPGHWEGDLIVGKNNGSAIGTLVERSTRFTMLLHLPGARTAEAVRDQMVAAMRSLPAHLRRSLTYDQGVEMTLHHQISLAADLPVYFCDPASPWQRGTNENTNGLLRQYFPKGTDLSVHSAAHLDAVAAELNDRPRKTLAWKNPAEAFNQLLSEPFKPTGVASAP
jgi:transposase, IS30 family